ncbi:unnamed protein product, partial [Mesorhabditis spiculigera]
MRWNLIPDVIFFCLLAATVIEASCPDHVFLGCVLRLKAQRVPFERNMVNVIFNIGNEAKLLHTCKVYGSTLPCFREKVVECGDDRQRRVLNEVGKMLMFLCSPFSLYRQRQLIEHQECVRDVLALPATTGCDLQGTVFQNQMTSCRKQCQHQPTNFICLMKTWISEQNICTMTDIEKKCGEEAAVFYKDLQTTVFDPAFPVLCETGEEFITTVTTTTPKPTTTIYVRPTKKPFIIKNKIIKKPQLTNPFNTSKIVFGVVPSAQSINRPAFNVPLTTSIRPELMDSTPYVEQQTTTQRQSNYIPEMAAANPDVEDNVDPSLLVWQKPQVYRKPQSKEFEVEGEASTPRSIKVITLLKSWLPERLPGFESLFQFPGSAPKSQEDSPLTTTFTPIPLPTVAYRNTEKKPAPRRWRPWYMSGGENFN